MTEREKVLYDVAKAVYAAFLTRKSDASFHMEAIDAWNAAETFYEEMVKRLGEPGKPA